MFQKSFKETFADHIFQQVDEYAPGFRDSIVGYEVLSPIDLEREFNLTGGNIFHGAMSLDQLFTSRPVNFHEVACPKTPIGGMYLCGAGSHPGGGVMGQAGKLAARHVVLDEKKPWKFY